MPDSRQYKLAAEVLRQRAPTLSHEGRHAALDVADELSMRADDPLARVPSPARRSGQPPAIADPTRAT